MADRSSAAPQNDDGQRTIIHVGPAPIPRPQARATTPPPVPRPPAEARTPPAGAAAYGPGDILPGTRHRLIRRIGDGGMGTVFEAEHVEIERRVALKVLHPEFMRAPAIVEQFRREARAASKVGSEMIAEVFDFGELPDGRLWFTMELVAGPTLREELGGGPIPVARAIGILRQICKGLALAHKAGVVHRDVKPDNIVLTRRRGRMDAVKLLDFGIAVMLGEDLRPVSAGTPHYLAPELVAGAAFDGRADIYAVGCTAYEILVGRPPFGVLDADVDEVLGRHLAETAEAPSRVRTDVGITPALDRVILKCLAKLASNRYRNMGELEAALCAAQVESGVQTPWDDLPLPDEVDPELRDRLIMEMPDMHEPLPRGRRRWAMPALAVLCLGAGIGATYGWQRYAAQATASPVEADAAVVEADEVEPPIAPAPVAAEASAPIVADDLDEPVAAEGGGARRAEGRRRVGDAPTTPTETVAAGVAADPSVAPIPAAPASAEQAGAADLVASARKLHKAGLTDDAKEMFARALTYDPHSAAALRGMFEISYGRGAYDDALDFAERLVADAPQLADNHLKVGDACMKLREYDEARRSYERAAGLGASAAAGRLAKLDSVSPRPAAPAGTAPADDEPAKSDEGEAPAAEPKAPPEPAADEPG